MIRCSNLSWSLLSILTIWENNWWLNSKTRKLLTKEVFQKVNLFLENRLTLILEFFRLIIEKVFSPDYGLFIFDDETEYYWFNPYPPIFGSEEEKVY